MAEEYTPTTQEVREHVAWDAPDAKTEHARYAAFDRWLAAHDREERAKVREAVAAVLANPSVSSSPDVLGVVAALAAIDEMEEG